MDALLKLAQLYNMYTFKGPNTRKLEIAKEVDINYCIPDEINDDKQEKNYSGYNCLHIAALKCDGDMVEYFLSKGADLCKKGTFDGCTPVHMVVNNYRSIQGKFYWELTGLLQGNGVVNSLLCAHVKRDNSLNTKCNHGLSHFHIACMFDHLEAVEYFLKIGEPVDQVTNADSRWPGYTTLHFAVRYSSVRIAETLLKHGADANRCDAKGLSSLQLAVERLITVRDYLLMGTGVLHSFYEEEVQKIDMLMCLMLESIQKDSGVMWADKIGLISLHLGCMIKESSVLNMLLEMNSDLNVAVCRDSQFWSGWTPLHFAASISYKRFKLLLEHGAKINVKNVKGETPLDLFMKRFSLETVHSILSLNPDLMNITFSDNQTKLGDVILAMNDTDQFNELLKSLKNIDISVPLDSPIWPGYTVLHLALSSNNQFLLRENFHKTIDLSKDALPSETQAGTENKETRYWDIIQKCLTRGCKVTATNANGETPIHVAFKLLNKDLVLELLKYCEDDAVDSDNLSIFHIACMLNDVALVRHLLSKRSHLNLAVRTDFKWYEPESRSLKHTVKRLVTIAANSTALHTAVILDNKDICELLATNAADFYARDSNGSTPLHLTVPAAKNPKEASPRSHHAGFMAETAKERMATSLFSKLPDFLNWHTKAGLTYAHVAAFADNEKALERLIKRGAKIHAITTFPARFAGETPLHLAARVGCPRAAKVLIEAGANIHAENHLKKYETPLLYALDRLCLHTTRHFVDKLKLKDRGVGRVEPSGLTLLHLACASMELDWARELLERGADPNAQIRADFDFELAGFTPLHVVMTHVHVYSRCKPESFPEFVELLLDHGADATIESKYRGSPLHIAKESRFYDFRNTDMLNSIAMHRRAAASMLTRHRSYAINPSDKRGFSHFHLACVMNIVDVVEQFLKAGIDINHACNYFEFDGGYTGLHFAVQYHCSDTARLLIRRGADVNAESSRGETVLHTAMIVRLNDLDLLKMLVHYEADINARNYRNDTPLLCLVESGHFSLEKLRFFLSRKCSVDVTMYTRDKIKQGFIGLVLSGVAQADVTSTLELLIETCELQERIENGFNAIHNVASTYNWHGKLTVDAYMHVFLRFIDMGCDIDQRHDVMESTALHAAILLNNLEAIEALLRLGADINVTYDTPIPKEIVQQVQITNDPRAIRTGELMAAHVWKMKLVGFDLHPSNELAAEEFHTKHRMNPVAESACRDELTKMGEKTVGTCFIPKEFLNRKSLVVEYPTMPLVKKEAIADFFSDTSVISAQYPELCGLLLMKYRQIQNRMKMWQEAKSSLSFLITVDLPDLCIEAVLQYMKNEEINVFLSNVHKLKETVSLL